MERILEGAHSRGYSDDGMAPHESMWLTREHLEEISLGAFFEFMVQRREKLNRLYGESADKRVLDACTDAQIVIDVLLDILADG